MTYEETLSTETALSEGEVVFRDIARQAVEIVAADMVGDEALYVADAIVNRSSIANEVLVDERGTARSWVVAFHEISDAHRRVTGTTWACRQVR